MYVGAVPTFDVPVATVQDDPLATVQSNIPGLVMSAPDVLVGNVEPVPSTFPWWVLAIGVLLLLSSNKKRG